MHLLFVQLIKREKYIPFILIFILFSCKTIRITETSDISIPSVRRQYIEKYKNMAVSEMKRSGVPASITLAQGILESDDGNGRLARKANNHFGIKCHNNWKGKKIYHDDDKRKECFRKYSNAAQSFRDHSDFLRNTRRYASLFDLDPANYKGWARGLKKAGYATDPKYDNLLIKIIEESRLYQYDNLKRVKRKMQDNRRVKENESNVETALNNKEGELNNETEKSNGLESRISKRNRINYIIVSEGDTYSSLERDFNMMHWELIKYNDLPEEFQLQTGMILYLQPKRNKAAVDNDFHIIEKGETMHGISQKYGIKLDKLSKLNRMEPDKEPEPGYRLWLRRTRPEEKKTGKEKTFKIEFD